jgi:hypothetical protein
MTSGGFYDFDREMRVYRRQHQTHAFLDHWMFPMNVVVLASLLVVYLIKVL